MTSGLNPYLPPSQSDPSFAWPTGNELCYRDGSSLFVREGATLPPFCPFTGHPAALDWKLTPLPVTWMPATGRRLIWIASAAGLIIAAGDHWKLFSLTFPMLGIPFGLAAMAKELRRSAKTYGFVYPPLLRSIRRKERLSFLLIVLGLLSVFAPVTAMLLSVQLSPEIFHPASLLLFATGLLVAFSIRRLRVRGFRDGWFRILAISPPLLNALPPTVPAGKA